jgi:hypothetical protein
VELGIKRVEEALGSLGLDGLKMGSGDGQSLVCEKDAGFTNLKPKRKNRRNKKKKNRKKPSRPKPGITLVVDEAGAKPMRPTLETQSFQAGESSETGAGRAAGVLGSRPPVPVPSILGKFRWVRKVGQSEVEEAELDVSPTEVCESGLGLGFAARSMYEVDSSSQMAPTVESRYFDQLGETRVSTEQAIVIFGANEDHRCVSGGPKLSTESSQCLKGGDATKMDTHMVAQVSGFAPWYSGGLVLENAISRGHAVEKLNPGAMDARTEGVGGLYLPIQNNLLGLEMVLYEDGEPIPLDWSQATEVVCGDGIQEIDTEVELIMALSNCRCFLRWLHRETQGGLCTYIGW